MGLEGLTRLRAWGEKQSSCTRLKWSWALLLLFTYRALRSTQTSPTTGLCCDPARGAEPRKVSNQRASCFPGAVRRVGKNRTTTNREQFSKLSLPAPSLVNRADAAARPGSGHNATEMNAQLFRGQDVYIVLTACPHGPRPVLLPPRRWASVLLVWVRDARPGSGWDVCHSTMLF